MPLTNLYEMNSRSEKFKQKAAKTGVVILYIVQHQFVEYKMPINSVTFLYRYRLCRNHTKKAVNIKVHAGLLLKKLLTHCSTSELTT